jgi:divalent metal cation (Fe/Co/Zn/Cd) transporter
VSQREEMHTLVHRRTVRSGELALYAILGAFLGYELVAHFTHYRYGRTLSAIIVAGDHSKILWLAVCARLAVFVGAVVLLLHLEGWLW